MEWEPFKSATKPTPSIKWLKKHFKLSKPDALTYIEQCEAAEIFLNNRYEVERRFMRYSENPNVPWPDMYWLSIKRIDKEPIHDWRDLQRIKTELVGPENEGIELYPAESRLVDGANQFHLWVLADTSERFPIGFNDGRKVGTPESAAKIGAKQRAF